jgi:cholera toxin transcriptional activator
MLVERPGEVIGREEIRKQLWPDGTFVDFDHSLNTAINKVREVLEDSAANPRFVETVPKRGYRFIAPTEVIEPKPVKPETIPAPPPESPGERTDPDESGLLDRILSRPEQLPQTPPSTVRTLFLLVQIMYLGFYVVSLARLHEVERILEDVHHFGPWTVAVVIIAAAAGIPARLYLITSVWMRAPGLKQNFRKMFPVLFVLDELWALGPFLLVEYIGFGLALGATAPLVYLPFAQRSLILMGAGRPGPRETRKELVS